LLAQTVEVVSLNGSAVLVWSRTMSLADADSFVSSNAPNRFFRQHHEVEDPQVDEKAFRPAWRIRAQLDRLLYEGKITGFEWRVAGWLRSCHERAHGSELRSPLAQVGMPGRAPRGGWRHDDPNARRAAAGEHLRHMEQALGPVVYGLVLAVVVEDLSWRELGKRCGCHAKTARAWAIEAVKVLATV
jgi:hypothetical protein